MSQSDQLVSKAIELQQNTLENSQQAMQEAMQIPIRGTVDFQRNAAQLMLNGLEIGNWFQNQSVELTRNALDTYLATVENAARDTSQLAQAGAEQAGAIGQQGLDATQQFATDATGEGSQESGTGMRLTSFPPQRPEQGVGRPESPAQRPNSAQVQPPTQPQPAAPNQQPSVTPQPPVQSPPQPPAQAQSQPPVQAQPSARQQPMGAQAPPPQQPPARAQGPPGAVDQQVRPVQQTQPAEQFQPGVATRPPAGLQSQPPRPPQNAPLAQLGPSPSEAPSTEPVSDSQRAEQRRGENGSNAVETPADTV